MAYYELKQFIDNAGHLITAKILVQPAGCDVYFNEKPEYKGVFVATIQTSHAVCVCVYFIPTWYNIALFFYLNSMI